MAGLTGQFAAVLRHQGDELVALVADHMGCPCGRPPDRRRCRLEGTARPGVGWTHHRQRTVAAHLMNVHWYAGRRTQYPGVFRVQPGTVTLLGRTAQGRFATSTREMSPPGPTFQATRRRPDAVGPGGCGD